ncbi:MAG TPA: SGNH/GDSL hydrolase family protein [Gemmatimonadaceae bacterium]|nr:SGNH/GDSL hydrolase family protein [Gemmatimonadaceae bacterium]
MADRTLVLLGDSILHNDPYTRPEPSTTDHLTRLLPDWTVRRGAVDGARMADVSSQLRQLAGRPTVAVLSVGGNDAVQHIGILSQSAKSSAEVLHQLLRIAEDFAERYEAVARAVAKQADRVVLCTIYEAPIEPPAYAELARVPLSLLNDRILRVGSRLGLDVLDLRSVCTDPADYVLQIEPSARGAAKIARAIAGLVAEKSGLGSMRVFAA